MIVTPEEVYKEYQRAKGKWSNPPYVAHDKFDFDKARKRPDWKVFLELSNKINQSNGMDLTYFINGLFYVNKDNIKKVYPRRFLNKEAVTAYIEYVEYLNTMSNSAQVENINRSADMIESYMGENDLLTFEDYLLENIDIYPAFITHLQNGILNYYLLTAYHKSSSILKRLNRDLLEDIEHYLKNREIIKMKLITIPEFTEATDDCLKRLGV